MAQEIQSIKLDEASRDPGHLERELHRVVHNTVDAAQEEDQDTIEIQRGAYELQQVERALEGFCDKRDGNFFFNEVEIMIVH
jgi:hypothetical protein